MCHFQFAKNYHGSLLHLQRITMCHSQFSKNYYVSLPSKFDQWQKIHPVLVLVQFDKSTNWRQKHIEIILHLTKKTKTGIFISEGGGPDQFFCVKFPSEQLGAKTILFGGISIWAGGGRDYCTWKIDWGDAGEKAGARRISKSKWASSFTRRLSRSLYLDPFCICILYFVGEFIHSEKLSCRYLKIQPLTLLHVIVSVIF